MWTMTVDFFFLFSFCACYWITSFIVGGASATGVGEGFIFLFFSFLWELFLFCFSSRVDFFPLFCHRNNEILFVVSCCGVYAEWETPNGRLRCSVRENVVEERRTLFESAGSSDCIGQTRKIWSCVHTHHCSRLQVLRLGKLQSREIHSPALKKIRKKKKDSLFYFICKLFASKEKRNSNCFFFFFFFNFAGLIFFFFLFTLGKESLQSTFPSFLS